MSACPVCGRDPVVAALPGLLRCCACGLVYMVERSFAEPVYEAGLEAGIYGGGKARLFASALDRLDKLLPVRDRLLDVGCAGGELMKAAAVRGWKPEGIELSPGLAARAAGSGLKVYPTKIENAGLQKDGYDAVTAFEVFSQMDSPASAIREMHRALRPGGVIYIREFNAAFHLPLYRLESAGIFKPLGVKPAVVHALNFNSRSLRFLLEVAGFTEIEIRNSPPTSGDPYRTGGFLGGVLTGAVKILYYFLAESVWVVSFGRLLAGSALVVTARKAAIREATG